MIKRFHPLRFGVPLRFADRWDGRLLACEVDSQWVVQNLVLCRGLLRRRRVRVPFAVVSHWDDEVVAFSAAADEVFAGGLSPVAVATYPLSAHRAVTGTNAKLVGLLVHHPSRRVSHLLLQRGSLVPQERMFPVDGVAMEAATIKLAGQVEASPLYRTDAELVQGVRQGIAIHPYLREDDRRGLNVEAVDGVVYLGGTVRTVAARNWAQECARQVHGVFSIQNEVVDDPSLEMAVGQALAAAGLFRQARVFVRSIKGEVLLSGFASSQEVINEIQQVAVRVAGVRGVSAKLQIQPPQMTAEAAKAAAASLAPLPYASPPSQGAPPGPKTDASA